MAIYTINVFEENNLGFVAFPNTTTTGNVSADAQAGAVKIIDNDDTLHDDTTSGGGTVDPDGAYSQIVAEDVTIGGVLIAAGSTITSSGKGLVTNNTTGESGYRYGIMVAEPDGGNPVYFHAFTITINAGDSLTYQTTSSSVYPVGEELYANYAEQPLCFEASALVETPNGPQPAASLQSGDLVDIFDSPPAPLIWTASFTTMGVGRGAPVAVPPSLFGNQQTTPVLFSQAHRILVPPSHMGLLKPLANHWIRARHLAEAGFAKLYQNRPTAFVHLMIDGHRPINTAGIWSETFRPGDYGISLLPTHKKTELKALLPGTVFHRDTPFRELYPTAKRKYVMKLRQFAPIC